MSYAIPSVGHPAREMIDMVSMVEILAPENVNKLKSTWEAKKEAIWSMENNKAIKRMCFVIIRADSDERWLISIGPRGGWKKEWNFGNGH